MIHLAKQRRGYKRRRMKLSNYLKSRSRFSQMRIPLKCKSTSWRHCSLGEVRISCSLPMGKVGPSPLPVSGSDWKLNRQPLLPLPLLLVLLLLQKRRRRGPRRSNSSRISKIIHYSRERKIQRNLKLLMQRKQLRWRNQMERVNHPS